MDAAHVLEEKKDVLSVRAPRELVSDVVRDGNDQTPRVEEVAGETESSCALAPHDLDNLRQLDDAPSEDDAESEDLGDGVADAVGRIKVGIPDESRVAFLRAARESCQHVFLPVESLRRRTW